jgi:hypothetical protein
MERNTIIQLEDIMGDNHDFRVCDECGRLTLTEYMHFTMFEKWRCESCRQRKCEECNV